jgi:hypothetical protein
MILYDSRLAKIDSHVCPLMLKEAGILGCCYHLVGGPWQVLQVHFLTFLPCLNPVKYYYAHFTDEETKPGEWLAQTHLDIKSQSKDSNSGLSDSEPETPYVLVVGFGVLCLSDFTVGQCPTTVNLIYIKVLQTCQSDCILRKLDLCLLPFLVQWSTGASSEHCP